MCLILTLEFGITTVDYVDLLISAELPDPSGEDAFLFQIVREHMVNGPCNVNCLVNGVCKKRFPKLYVQQTRFTANDHPLYRRRNLPFLGSGNATSLSAYVFPYNRELSRIYESHKNVELCNTLGTIKYLNK
ncbi:hypothetical protein CDIK_2877 [Cucumispora dikerogammari]|nr:hypothetical protein CDIK_2877 [Cucumispora dikerogammari]